VTAAGSAPRVAITYCTQCRWLLRAGWLASELLTTFTTEREDIVLLGRETILRDGAFAGYLTSGGYGYTIGKPIGLGYVRNADGLTEDWVLSGKYELIVAGEKYAATPHLAPLYDPEGLKVKA
jgi:4-methylaminobutanoate oxidase (formaldehyde-forming)